MSLLALNGCSDSADYLARPVALKLMRPDIFNGLLNDEVAAHLKAMDLIEKMEASEDFHFWAKSYFTCLHATAAGESKRLSNEQIEEFKRLSPSWYRGSGSPLKFWLKRLDIAIQD